MTEKSIAFIYPPVWEGSGVIECMRWGKKRLNQSSVKPPFSELFRLKPWSRNFQTCTRGSKCSEGISGPEGKRAEGSFGADRTTTRCGPMENERSTTF